MGLTPGGAGELIHAGHQVIVEKHAGSGIGLENEDYAAAGAEIVDSAQEIYARAEMIIKVKEPQPVECRMLSEGQVLFTYLHLAPDPEQTRLLVDSGCTAIAYETVTDADGGLPLLAPMSEVAGRLSIQAGAHCLEKYKGGNGTLLGGVPGVVPAKVLIIGGGVAGENAARIAMGMGASVAVMDVSLPRLAQLDQIYGPRLMTVFSKRDMIDQYATQADLVVGSVLIPGASAPKLVTREHIKAMRKGTVVVDVAIDQGGCFETSKPTTHENPTFIVDDVVHYCVANMPGAVPRTSTFALANATLPFALSLANKGCKQALADDPHLMNGLNVHAGQVTYAAVARDLGYEYVKPAAALGL